MELRKVAKKDHSKVINSLSHQYSAEEFSDIQDNFNMYFEEGSHLYAFYEGEDIIGFTVVSIYAEAKKILELVLDEFYFNESLAKIVSGNNFVSEIKKLNKQIKPERMEILVTQDIAWFGKILSEAGMICESIKLEKVLPNQKNLVDVLELIKDSIPLDSVGEERIVQVLFERGDEYKTELIASKDDVIIEEGWTAIMVILSIEPRTQQIQQIIEQSNQLINWDDYEITYIL